MSLSEASPVDGTATDDHHYQDSRLLILYATETGNALDVAEQIAQEALNRSYDVYLTSTDEYPLQDLVHETTAIFVVSTTGSGQEPRSMTHLWTMLLRSDLPSDLFEGLDFAVFGLGDSAYEKFCWAAKLLSRRLESLGGRLICPRGEADDQNPEGVDGALDKWMPILFSSLTDSHPEHSIDIAADTSALHPPRIVFRTAYPSTETIDDELLGNKATYHRAVVKKNDRITAKDWTQDVRHIEFEFKDDFQYSPGDIAVIHPIIPADEVESFLVNVGWSNEADIPISYEESPNTLPVPSEIPRTTTLRALFTRHLDINAVPKRSFFKVIRHFAQEELEKEKLAEFCSIEGAEDLYDYVTRVRRTIKEVLEEFHSVKVPKEYIFDVFPVLRPRQFSIASSVKVHLKQIHLCVAIVRYKTKLKTPRRGVCTAYLSTLNPDDELVIGIQKGLLSLPRNASTPVICIGPGTGVAPMRALLQERIYNGSKENTLYFGCRSASKDYHYSSEWKDMSDSGNLIFRGAFSRDGPEGVQRTYVQDLMSQDGERLWKLINDREGWVYISGSSNKMPAAVKKAIESAAVKFGGLSETEAGLFVKNLQENGRLFEECWS